ncbi:MAG: metallophosphoesterase [Deltaproteobacteria bacterium]|nr:metallophosphoesterase [Deltaproteobacteria bacterium]
MLLRWLVLFSALCFLSALALRRLLKTLGPRFWARHERLLQRALGLLVLALVLAEFTAKRYAPVGGGPWRVALAVLRGGFLIAWLGALASLVGALVSRLVVRFWKEPARPLPEAPGAPLERSGLTRREALDRGFTGAGLAVASAVVLRGGMKARYGLRLTDVTLTVPTLPPELEGFTLVQLTDLHVGLFTGAPELEHLVDEALRARGDVIVLTGDLLDHAPRHIPEALRRLSRLRAPRGVYSILGNHDHTTGARQVARGLQRARLHPLVNAGLTLPGTAGRRPGLYLAGVDDVWAGRFVPGANPDLPRALGQRAPEEPAVLLAHNPVFFMESAGLVDVQLSGHTHGGQVNLGGLPGALLPFIAGRYTRRGSGLFVSRGVGVTGPPVRINAPPELVRIALTARRV